MVTRSTGVRVGVGLAVMAAFATFAVVSSRSQQEGGARSNDGRDVPPGRPIAMPTQPVGLEIRLGLKGDLPPAWEGDVRVSEGRVLDVEVLGPPGATAEGGRFSAKVQAKAKAKNKNKNKQVAKKKQQQQGTAVRPMLLVSLDAPASATVTVKVGPDEFSFPLANLPADSPGRFLEDRVSVERRDAATRLTGRGTDDDYPVLARGADGAIWLAYVTYQADEPRMAAQVPPEKFDTLVAEGHGDRIRLARFDGRAWQPPVDVTDAGLDIWRPAVAVDGKGGVWVAWSQQVDGNWDIYTRRYTPATAGAEGSWSDRVRLTDAKGPDVHAVAATDSEGTVWLAWQGWRDGNFDILVSALPDDHPRHEPRAISESKANDWMPAIAADATGNVVVAWDTYDKGNYDVRLRAVGGDSAEVRAVADSPRFEARPSLAYDAKGRLWIAYEEGDEQWGKDYSTNEFEKIGFKKNPGYALYINRTVGVKCLADGSLRQPAGPPAGRVLAEALDRNVSLPRLAVDASGGVWLSTRHHPLASGAGEVWVSSVLRHDGKAWSPPRLLPRSTNLMDNRPAQLAIDKGILVVRSSDARSNSTIREDNDLYATVLVPSGPAADAPELVADRPVAKAEVPPVHPDEAEDVARMRAYRVEVGGKSLRLLRGEFHRHTEYTAHRDQDGLLEDSWRYALDAGGLDWMGNGDHDNGHGWEYAWWTIQKVADIYNNPPVFVAAQTYERSVVYPNGHRNVMMPVRGIRPLPRGVLEGSAEAGTPDTKMLYAYLKKFAAICSSHTSGTNMGTDWRDNDGLAEPVVEIYQGHRHNYEHFGAPRSPTAETQIGGYQPAGFIWNALEKGYKLGFQSSSDHVSTHWSYAVVLAEDTSRRGIIDAFKRRHSYAATDNIILDVRSGDHIMGDAFETRERPTLAIVARGTKPITRLHIIRDNKYVFSTEPGQLDVKLRYTDDDEALKPGKASYYYVRVQQEDGNLAWASPMWITYKP